MRRGQAGVETAIAALLVVALLGAFAAAGARVWSAAAERIDQPETARRGQALVELLALLPLIAACGLGFGVACTRLAATAEAERALGRAIRADAAGEPIAEAARPARLRIEGRRLVVRVSAPFGGVEVSAERIL